MATVDAAADVGLAPRLALGFGVPLAAWQRGDRLAGLGAGDDRPLGSPRFGDVRLRAKLALASRGALRFALAAIVTVPAGGERDFSATAGPTVEPRLIVDFVGRWLTVAAHAGVRFAPERALFATRFTDELEYAAGAAAGPSRIRVVAELAGAVGPDIHPLEARAALRLRLPLGFSVDAGAGAGLIPDPTAPSWRLFAIVRR